MDPSVKRKSRENSSVFHTYFYSILENIFIGGVSFEFHNIESFLNPLDLQTCVSVKMYGNLRVQKSTKNM